MTDTDGYSPAATSETSPTDFDSPPRKPANRVKANLHNTTESNGTAENGDIPMSTLSASSPKPVHSRKRNKPKPIEVPSLPEKSPEPTPPPTPPAIIEKPAKITDVEVTSITDDEEEEEENERDRRIDLQKPSQTPLPDYDTMVSSYTTGGDSDVIEIHQFSLSDVDVYLDIYFETLNNRLRHYVGQNEQLQEFRARMKNRIVTNTNDREYQNVLLGKMNGEVVAAVTMSFPGDTPTIPHVSEDPGQNSCMKTMRGWMIRKANYIPTNMEECYIEMIGVKKSYQKRGVGAAMLECVEHYARQAGATVLTIHTVGAELRSYFERFGFNVDHTDNSSFWKWVVERQSVNKLSKAILAEGETNGAYAAGSYLNESIAESIDES